MREIKFRAWDKEAMNWAYSDPMPDFGFWKWVKYDTTTAFYQYTGLKDKNGVEIYEGDIVSHEGFTGVVEYNAPEFIVNDMIWTMEPCEVIGNIYENPELLK